MSLEGLGRALRDLGRVGVPDLLVEDLHLDVAEQFPADRVGVVVDTFHVWWDPQLDEQVRRAGSRIASYQVCDWITPRSAA